MDIAWPLLIQPDRPQICESIDVGVIRVRDTHVNMTLGKLFDCVLQHVACEMRENAHGNAHLRLSEAACFAACGASVQRSAAEGTWPGARVHLVRPCAL